MDLQIYMSNILLPFLFLIDNPWQLWISWAGLSKSLMIGVDIAIDIFDMKLWYTSVSFDIFYGYSWADLCKSLMREVDIAGIKVLADEAPCTTAPLIPINLL